MTEILLALFAFFLAIIILVTVHEFGHYWVAKKCGVSVLNFSVGFGKTLYSWQRAETTYHIKAIPLGGFVDMLESKKHKIEPDQFHLAFDKKSLFQRSAIVAAGPIANLILAIVLYMGSFMVGTQDLRPTIKEVAPNSFASQAGLRSGDTFLKINGINTPGIDNTLNEFLTSKKIFKILVDNPNGGVRELVLTLSDDWLDEPKSSLTKLLGFSFLYPSVPAVVGRVLDGGLGQKAGLTVDDEITAINGQSVDNWHQMSRLISKDSSQTLMLLEFERAGITQIRHIQFDGLGKHKRLIGIGAKVPDDYYEQNFITVVYSPMDAFGKAMNKTYETTMLNLTMIKRILLGDASIKHINGPVGVAQYAGKSLELSWQIFVGFLALMSIAIAVFNLLPIPLLDGGHLFFYLIEFIKRSPVSESFQGYFNYFGLSFIAILTSVALYNDVSRLMN